MVKKLVFENGDRDGRPGILKELLVSGTSLGKKGLGLAQWIAKKTGRTGWILLTSAVVTIIPLAFEVRREAQLIELEKLNIKILLSEGKTRYEIASMGLFSALDPNVMGPETS